MKLHTIEGHIQSLYLAEYPDRLLLLDGGCRADAVRLERFVEQELGRSMSELKAVVVTHMHPDHAGAAPLLRQRYGCQIVMGDQPGHWYQGLAGLVMHWMDLVLAMYVASRKGSPAQNLWYGRKLTPDIRLADGESVPGFDDWQLWHTIGHTDRDLSLYHAGQDILYVADLVVELKSGKLVAPFPVFLPHQYRYSLQRVYQAQPKRLLLAHHGEIELDTPRFEQLYAMSPRTPMTHWWVIRIKSRQLLKSWLLRKKAA